MLDEGPGLGGYMGALGGVAGFVVGFIFGILGGLAVLCGVGAVGGLISLFRLGYRCGRCEHAASKRVLSGPEVGQLRKRQLWYVGSTVLSGLGAVVLGSAWLCLAAQQMPK